MRLVGVGSFGEQGNYFFTSVGKAGLVRGRGFCLEGEDERPTSNAGWAVIPLGQLTIDSFLGNVYTM